MNPISIAIHGGAGNISKNQLSESREKAATELLRKTLSSTYQMLRKNATAIEVVEHAVMLLEDDPLFNAGKGSVFNHLGKQEMDAAIMDGRNLEAGAVANVKNVKNPIALARLVMDKSEHVLLAGAGAEDFARLVNCPFEADSYFFDQLRYDQLQNIKDSDKSALDHSVNTDEKYGTVGAVAFDAYGNLAAATSTGGMTNKKYGRIGDSPLIGAGTYANNKTCAVSCTGSGEYFIRSMAAIRLSCLMEYKGLDLQAASKEVIEKTIAGLGGSGGLIAVDTKGNIAMPFNTTAMYRGAVDGFGGEVVGVF
ncbi:MAG: isoaspartyl peptidase/L-asparaginase [Chitinophagales bacterium]